MSTVSVDLMPYHPYTLVMLSPEQSRAARGWLDWSQEELASRANVSMSTVRDFEKGRRTPISNNLNAIENAFAAAGVILQSDDTGRPNGIQVITAEIGP